jgi:hypothetical protein
MNQKIDLSGNWAFRLDPACEGLEKHFETADFDDVIRLPGTVSYRQKGEPGDARETGYLTESYRFEGYAWYRKKVTLPYRNAGELAGKHFFLTLERTRISHVWVDGTYVGSCDTLVGNHTYDLTKFLTSLSFQITILVANVGYPVAGGHLTSPDTAGNWNGILGEIALRVADGLRILSVSNESNVKEHKTKLTVHAELFEDLPEVNLRADVDLVRLRPKYAELDANCTEWYEMGVKYAEARGDHRDLEHYLDITEEYVPSVVQTLPSKTGTVDWEIPIELPKRAPLWDEEDPYIYRVRISAFAGGKGAVKTTFFGLKDFHAEGGDFVINGRKTFLRGCHEGLLFPMTGFAPMNAEGWLWHLKIYRNWGINHVRFHSATPPEAAFLAADLLGIYLQPEIEFWGTWTGPEDVDHDQRREDYLIREGRIALESFGAHPSFAMFGLGNELWGDAKELNRVLGTYKKDFPDILFTQGSNNFQWTPCIVPNDDFFSGVRFAENRLIRGSYAQCDAPLGHIQTKKPCTDYTYDEAIRPTSAGEKADPSAEKSGTTQIQYGTGVKEVALTDTDAGLIPEIPVISHEIGQYETYPDYSDINHFSGVMRARNLEVFRERLEAAGLGDLAHDYFASSGALAVACYKDEIETALRSKELAGFQLLDLKDYTGQGTALVGMLNGLMENKGLINPDRWREFCSDGVVQAEFDSYVVRAGEDFTFRATMAYYRRDYLEDGILFAQLIDRKTGDHIAGMRKDLPMQMKQGRHDLGRETFQIPDVDEPRSYLLEVGVIKHHTTVSMSNQYVLWSYPATLQEKTLLKTEVVTKLSEAKKISASGKNVLLYDTPAEKDSIPGTYCTDFWCYPMFRSISESMGKPIPVGTMGLLIQNDHPALAGFPCEGYTTPQWYDIVNASRSRILDGQNVRPIVQTIDNFERNHLLGLLYELQEGPGKVLACTADLPKLIREGDLAAAWLQTSLLNYLEEN